MLHFKTLSNSKQKLLCTNSEKKTTGKCCEILQSSEVYVFSVLTFILDVNPAFCFQYATVVRGGSIFEVKAEEIALGDIVNIKFGDRVPADVRVITAHGFKVLFLLIPFLEF